MKILQWNIWYKENIDNVLKTLKEIDADILCLQEITINDEHNEKDCSHYVADKLGYDFFYEPAQIIERANGEERSYGNAIFSRTPMKRTASTYIQPLQHEHEDQPLAFWEQGRVYLEADVETESGSLTVGTVHMSYTTAFQSTPAKEREVGKLLEILQQKKQKYIVTGDFNATPNSKMIGQIQEIMKNAGPAMTEMTWTTKPFSYQGFEASMLDWRLDYCFSTSDVKIKSASIVNTPYSDHLPILLEL